MARLVVPDYPHHVTQRGNRRQRTFFSPSDYRHYIDEIARAIESSGTAIWAWCLMPNHVHFVAVPEREDSLARLFAEAHRRYTCRINFRNRWQGHLWQERFHSCVMDEYHLLACARYVELNPVRAGLCARAEDWAWSSARAHLAGANDELTDVTPLLERVTDWKTFLDDIDSGAALDSIRQCSRTGRPLGDVNFISELEARTGRQLRPKRAGRPAK